MKKSKGKIATSIKGNESIGRLSRRVAIRPLAKKYTEIEIKGMKTNFIDFI